MKIRHARAALLAFLGIGAILLTTTPAYAVQADAFYITAASGGTRYFLIDHATLHVQTAIIPTIWTNIHGEMWGNRPVYEWAIDGSNTCWAWSASSEMVFPQVCDPGNKTQLWWQNNGHFINWQATLDANGSSQCMNAEHLQEGSLIDTMGCKNTSQPGWWDQLWYSVSS